MYFWNFGDFQVVGASPEIRCAERIVDNGVPKSQITIRPLAGTRKRGATPEEDAALAAELKADPKEVAEHVMLIDRRAMTSAAWPRWARSRSATPW